MRKITEADRQRIAEEIMGWERKHCSCGFTVWFAYVDRAGKEVCQCRDYYPELNAAQALEAVLAWKAQNPRRRHYNFGGGQYIPERKDALGYTPEEWTPGSVALFEFTGEDDADGIPEFVQFSADINSEESLQAIAHALTCTLLKALDAEEQNTG